MAKKHKRSKQKIDPLARTLNGKVFSSLMRESLPSFAADILLKTIGPHLFNGSYSSIPEDRPALRGCFEEAAVSVRMNPFKRVCAGGDGLQFDIISPTVIASKVPYCKEALFLRERVSFTLDPAFHAGAYYVQDSSSMFLELLKDVVYDAVASEKNDIGRLHTVGRVGAVLDLCASPGGKSTHLVSLLNTGFLAEGRGLPLIVCNEAVNKRVAALCGNMARWGALNTIVTNTSAANIGRLDSLFDVILADVPCSGEGMFRKSEEAVMGWSVESVAECAELQRSIIRDVWPSLREGGILIYSTCTYNHIENQDNVKYIAETLGADLISFDSEIQSTLGFASENGGGIVKLDWGYQFLPGLVHGEGQFFAVLRKTAVDAGIQKSYGEDSLKSRTGNRKADEASRGQCGRFSVTDARLAISEAEVSSVMLQDKAGKQLFMLPADRELALFMKTVAEAIEKNGGRCVKMIGCKIGEFKAGKIIPDADLALTPALSVRVEGAAEVKSVKVGCGETILEFACVDVDRRTALNFLSKENITPRPDWPKGYILLKFNSLGLGFVNNLGTRCNNLHPMHRRILNKSQTQNI